MKEKQKKQTKPLLVLGAVATLSAQFSTDLALIAYALPTTWTQHQASIQESREFTLAPLQKNSTDYILVNQATYSLPDVELNKKGVAGETLTQSFTLTKEGTGYLNHRLTLAGPSDSQVTVKINGITYLNTTVGRGKLEELSFFGLYEGDLQIEMTYVVGSEEEVLPGQPWVKFSDMTVIEQTDLSRPLEYRVKGSEAWQSYNADDGIKTQITEAGDRLTLEGRYTDEEHPTLFEFTINAPQPRLPLMLLEEDGYFYLNHFDSSYNKRQLTQVKFNNGEWQDYHYAMTLPLENNECTVQLRVINNYGIEVISEKQIYRLPELQAPTIQEEDGVVTLTDNTSSVVNSQLDYQLNGGDWQVYTEPFTLDYQNGSATVDFRVTDVHGRVLEVEEQSYIDPKPTGGEIQFDNGTVTIETFETQSTQLTTETYYRVNNEAWTLYEEPFTLTDKQWQETGIVIEAKGVNNHGTESEIQTLSLDSNDRLSIKPSISKVEHYYGAFRRLDTIRFGVWAQTNGGSAIALNEWSTDGVNWNKFSHTVDVQFTTAGDHILYLRTTNEDGVVSDIYEHPITVVEAVAPEVLVLNFQEDELFVGGDYEPYYEIKYEEGAGIDYMIWGGDYDTMFDSPGEKTITLKVQDNRGLWSNEMSHTFTVKDATKPVIHDLTLEETDLIAGDTYDFYYEIEHEEGTTIDYLIWGGDHKTAFDTPGQKTVTLQVIDNRKIWSEEASYTFTVREAKAPVIQGVNPSQSEYLEGDTIQFDYLVDYDGQADYQAIDWLSGYPLSNQVGTHQVTFRIQDSRGLWSDPFTYTYEVKQRLIEPTLTFSSEVLQVPYGSALTSIYKKGVMLDAGTATTVKYGAYQDTFNPNKLGKQQVKYLIKYEQNGVEQRKYVYRTIEVMPVDPTLTFSSSVLKVPYGSSLTSIYKKGVTLNSGSATNVKYAAYQDTFNPNKLGKQKVKYLIKYTQNGVEKRAYAYRYIEVTPVDPTLSFSSSVLKVPYGSSLTSIYKKGVTVNTGSATNVKYAAYQDTFNPNKLGKQKVKYLIKYTQNGVEKRAYAYRYIEVTAVNPTLTFSKTTLTAKYGQTPNFNSGVTLNKGSATKVTYSVVKNSYNPNKRGTQKIKYQLTYTQNGKTYKTIVERPIVVK